MQRQIVSGSLLMIGSLFLVNALAYPRAEGGLMFSYKILKNPEQFFDIELKLYNAVTLNQLIPSIEKPPVRVITEKNGQTSTVDFSGYKYIFGSIKYKHKEDVLPLTTVTLRISSPNNLAGLNPHLKDKDIVIECVSESKIYFLIPIPPVAVDTSDDQAILKPTIIRAIGVKP